MELDRQVTRRLKDGFWGIKMVNVYVVSAFCRNNKGGNKAGVVLNGQNLNDAEKLDIAKELGYSETAFIFDSYEADFRLQYFTPTKEVPLCGHATIAAFSILRLLEMLDRQNYSIETKAGVLDIQVKENGMIFMEQNCPTYFEVLSPDVFMGCMEKNFFDRNLPIQIVSTGLKDIMLPIDSRIHLDALAPNFKRIAELSKEREVVGVHAFTLMKESDITAICRNFAPLYGIDEESATGTSNCALGCYLFKYYEKKSRYIFEQGHSMGEISRIVVNIVSHEDVIDAVYVGGHGYLLEKKILPV